MYKKRSKHIHFVGIGGIGMSGIAEVLLNLGYKVSGSDLKGSAITARLAGLGAVVNVGHRAEWLGDAEVAVCSSAIGDDNPEVIAAREAGIPVIPRAEMLAELMRLKKFGIAVAGSHGKTTTTSMAGWVLGEAGLDPTVIIGGRVDCFGSNARPGKGEFLLAEADESDGSFIKLSPVLEIVTNIDFEHVDYYPDLAAVKTEFNRFIRKIPFYGAVIVCIDDHNIADILPGIRRRTITYGTSSQAMVCGRDIRTNGLESDFEVRVNGEILGRVRIGLPGEHSVRNTLAVIALGLELEIPFAGIKKALGRFSGIQRRMQIRGEAAGITVIDDYGHHPTEIRATLKALRQAWPRRRLVVLFQPHRYSRTAGLFNDFCTAFHRVDRLYLTDIYPAGEKPVKGVDSAGLAAAIKEHGHRRVENIVGTDRPAELIAAELEAGDIFLTLGAGDIHRVGEDVCRILAGP